MQYLVVFLEGIITFISPCLLPMLPIYVLYFAGDKNTQSTRKTLINSLGFVLGFTIIFVILGVFAATVGVFLKEYQLWVNIITGLIVVIFGLNFMGVIKIKFLNAEKKANNNVKMKGFFSAVLFGMIFSIGWTPCVGAFLGSALLLASQQGEIVNGVVMLLLYSLGLGIPFVLSAVLIEKLKTAFNFIKKHYTVINRICGGLLIVIGILMMTGLMNRVLSFLK